MNVSTKNAKLCILGVQGRRLQCSRSFSFWEELSVENLRFLIHSNNLTAWNTSPLFFTAEGHPRFLPGCGAIPPPIPRVKAWVGVTVKLATPLPEILGWLQKWLQMWSKNLKFKFSEYIKARFLRIASHQNLLIRSFPWAYYTCIFLGYGIFIWMWRLGQLHSRCYL